MSAVGTSYEEDVYQAVLEMLHLDRNVFSPEFYGELRMQRGDCIDSASKTQQKRLHSSFSAAYSVCLDRRLQPFTCFDSANYAQISNRK
jgi:hypothetical protein